VEGLLWIIKPVGKQSKTTKIFYDTAFMKNNGAFLGDWKEEITALL